MRAIARQNLLVASVNAALDRGHGRPMNKPLRPKGTAPDIPSKIADRPRYVELTLAEERAFVQKLAEYEAAFRQTGDPLPLWEALCHVELAGQTVPHWLATVFPPPHAGHERR